MHVHTYTWYIKMCFCVAVDGEMQAIQKQQSAKRSLCEVLSSEIGFLKRRSLNIMEAIVQLDQQRKKQN